MSIQEFDTIWVFSAGMRRSGSTLQYHLARELVEYVGGYAAGWVTWQRFAEVYKELDGSFPMVVLKCHAFMPTHSSIADILFQKNKVRALTIFRDPVEVATSMFRMERDNYPNKPWSDILLDLEAALREFMAWSALPEEQCLVQAYTQSSKKMLREISGFLNILYLSIWEKDCLERHTLDAHRELMVKHERWSEETLLWHNHIGDDKIELTTEQLVDVEKIVEDWKMKL